MRTVNNRLVGAGLLVGLLFTVAYSQTKPDADCSQPSTLNPSPLGCIQSRYDRFDNRSTVSLDWMLLSRSKTDLTFLSVAGSYDGSEPRRPDTFIVLIYSFSDNNSNQTPGCELTILVGDHRLSYKVFPPIQKTINGRLGEMFGAETSYADLRLIANADSVAMRLCYRELPVTREQAQAIGRYLDRVWSKNAARN